MHFLFEPVQFRSKYLCWSGKSCEDRHYPGYYHWHQCTEMLYVHRGEGSIIVNQRAFELRRGMLFLFQPFQLHKIYADVGPDKPFERTIFYFDPSQLESYLLPFPKRHARFVKLWRGQGAPAAFEMKGEAQRLESILEGYGNLSAESREHDTEEITMLLLQLMGCIEAARSGSEERTGNVLLNRKLRYSEQIMQWIEEHYADEVSLEQIAETLHLSKYYVSRIFHEETGGNISDYLTARRIKQACRLLQSTVQPVEHIGASVGYPNVSYFIQMFKRVVGTTPLKYRQRHKAD